MNSLLLTLLAVVGYLIAYRTYGRYLGRSILAVSRKNVMPSEEFNDGVDFVPTKAHILFGHHFTTIAGLGPIVGPAIGIIWGWLPAFLWVFFGSIFMGAMHDFSTLIISARHKGKSMGDLTGEFISPYTRYAFQFIMQLLLFIVLSVFAMIVGVLFKMFPEAVIPVWMQIPIAVWLGWQIRKGKNDLLYSIIAVALMYATIIIGIQFPIRVPEIMGSEVVTWSLLLFIYVFFASTLPVQKLLQPRDYINSHQLLVAILLLILGLIVAHPPITAPAINPEAMREGSDIPSLMPLLFITIACGAISGFHSLASSGTTVKQLKNEQDAQFIGFGGMIWESFLAVLVLMAIAAGLGMGMEKDGILYTGVEAYRQHYHSWASSSGLEAKLGAFITGSANLFYSFGIPLKAGGALVAVFIVSFANTTLDSAARIQRLSLQEITRKKDGTIIKPFQNRYFATLVIVIAAAALTFIKPGATGAMVMWPLFGSLNQLLAALALGIVSIYLYARGRYFLVSAIPMVLVLVVTMWAMFQNIFRFWQKDEYGLLFISILIIMLTLWLTISGAASILKKKNSN